MANLSFGEADGACVLPDCRWRLADIDRSDCDRTHTKRIAFNRAHLIGNTCGRQPPVRMMRAADMAMTIAGTDRQRTVPGFVPAETVTICGNRAICGSVFRPSKCKKALKTLTGGAGGIRTLDRALQPYNGLANRRLQPLGHSSIGADMPDIGASRKPEIVDRLIRDGLAVPVSGVGRDLRAFWATAFRNLGPNAACAPSLCCVCRKLQ